MLFSIPPIIQGMELDPAGRAQLQLNQQIVPDAIRRLTNPTGEENATGERSEFARHFPGAAGQLSSSEVDPERIDIEAETAADPTRRRLFAALQDFQAIFIKQMLGAMRKNLSPEQGLLHGGDRQKLFEDMLFDEYSKLMSKSEGFDLDDAMYAQWHSRLGPLTASETNAAGDSYNENLYRHDAEDRREYGRMIENGRHRISTDRLRRDVE